MQLRLPQRVVEESNRPILEMMLGAILPLLTFLMYVVYNPWQVHSFSRSPENYWYSHCHPRERSPRRAMAAGECGVASEGQGSNAVKQFETTKAGDFSFDRVGIALRFPGKHGAIGVRLNDAQHASQRLGTRQRAEATGVTGGQSVQREVCD